MQIHATTILSVRNGDQVAIGGDGQVTLNTTIIKSDAAKIRKLSGDVIVGFAGGVADAFALLDRLPTFRGRQPNWPKSGAAIALSGG